MSALKFISELACCCWGELALEARVNDESVDLEERVCLEDEDFLLPWYELTASAFKFAFHMIRNQALRDTPRHSHTGNGPVLVWWIFWFLWCSFFLVSRDLQVLLHFLTNWSEQVSTEAGGGLVNQSFPESLYEEILMKRLMKPK
jgi:hypothetical protein